MYQGLKFLAQQSYLDTVKGGFRGFGINQETLFGAAFVLLAVIFLFFLGKGINLLLLKIRPRDIPPNWIIGKKRIAALLTEAMNKRSKFEMRFLPSSPSRKSTYCSLERIEKNNLALEISSTLKVSRNWISRNVEVFFKISHKDKAVFYRFEASILGIRNLNSGLIHVLLSVPDIIELQQKRAFLRVKPPSEYLMGCAIWQPEAVSLERHTNVKTWGMPILYYTPEKGSNPIAVENLSAGGIRLGFSREARGMLAKELNIGMPFLLMLDIFDPESQRKRRFWLHAKLQNLYEDYTSRNMELGLQFIRWGRPKNDAASQLEWTKVGGEGIELLATWVMRRHLELFRSKVSS